MKNYIQPGNVIPVIATVPVASGAGVLIGTLFGVAGTSAEAGETFEANLVGVFELPKQPSQAWAQGVAVYWDAGNARATTTAGSNVRIGNAFAAVGGSAGETLGRVRLGT